MKIKSVTAAFFSPTGNAKKIVCAIAEEAAARTGVPVRLLDFTLPEARDPGTGTGSDAHSGSEVSRPAPVTKGEDITSDSPRYIFAPGDLVILGTPVYAGRIPNKILPAFQTLFAGNGALGVPVVTFGNRSFDNALIEVRMEMEKHGFHTIAGGAFVSEHVFSEKLAGGRPDAEDMAAIRQFAADIAAKIQGLAEGPEDGMAEIPSPIQVRGEDPIPGYYRPLQADGSPANFLKAKPKTTDDCNDCGLCPKVCPMGSISPEDNRTIIGVCIKCQACVKFCPMHAKYFDDPVMLSHAQMLVEHYGSRRAQNEVFL